MKALIITLALILSMPVYASDIAQPQEQQRSTKDLLEKFKSKQSNSPTAELENQVVQLQIELRETRRKYYAMKTENMKLKDTQTAQAGYTEDQVRAIVNDAQSELYYDVLKYAVGEREFMLSLTTVEDIHWLLVRMKLTDIDRIKSIRSDDTVYLQDISDVVGEYKSYYDVNRHPAEAQQEEQ